MSGLLPAVTLHPLGPVSCAWHGTQQTDLVRPRQAQSIVLLVAKGVQRRLERVVQSSAVQFSQ